MSHELSKVVAGALLSAALPVAGWSISSNGSGGLEKPPQGSGAAEKQEQPKGQGGTRDGATKAETGAAGTAAEVAIDLTPLDRVGDACWSELRTRRMYFAHQAIGSEMLTGVRELMRRKPDMAFTITAYAEPDTGDGTVFSAFDTPALVEASAGKRGNPERKIEDFSKFLRSSEGLKVDVAVLKLCYGDIGRFTDVEGLFDRYTKAIEEIRRERPNIHFIHCTVPLKAEEHGARARLKRLVGAGSNASNAARSRYNDFVRQRFPEAQVFDIAAIESHRPDGTMATVDVGGKRVQTLADEYTEDGAHLNPLGQQILAREFLLTLSHQCGGEAERVTAEGGRAESPTPGGR